jgi:DNA-directed RNA polymerase specialized sigma24 family protein
MAFSPFSPEPRGGYSEAGRLVDPQAVRSALESMPEHLRVVLVEIYLAGRPVGELAGLLAISEDTVRAHAHQSLLLLRRALRHHREHDQRTTVMGDGGSPPHP